jgi:predicted XRE-type DNA-binding protein
MKSALVETRPGSNVYLGSGNVFTDLDFPDAEEMTTKVRLAAATNNIVAARNLSQKAAAKLLGINQPKVSTLQRFRLDGFPVGRLTQFATALHYDVVIEYARGLRRKAKGKSWSSTQPSGSQLVG